MKYFRQLLSPRTSIVLALLIGTAATVIGAVLLDRHNHQQAELALVNATKKMADAVETRLRLYQYGLRGARGIVVTSGEQGITRELFHRYSLSRDIAVEFPGARGFGFIRRVPKHDEARFLEQARADGKADFAIRQLTPHDDERFVTQYLEPVAGNALALGLDIGSEKARRQAALDSIRSGQVRLTAPITLVQAGKPRQSFLILMPIYRGATTPATVAEREAQAFGWSFAPLLTEEVLRGLELDPTQLHLRLRDVTDRQEMFYQSAESLPAPPVILTHTVERDVYGRRWQVELEAYPAYIKKLQQTSPSFVMAIGSLLTLLLTALIGVLSISRRRQLQVLAGQMRLAAIVESSTDGIIGKSLDGKVTSWNRGAAELFGYSAEEAIGRPLLELIVPADCEAEETEIQQRVGRGERVANFDTKRRCKDGRLIDVSVSIAPISDESGRVIGISKTVRDVSAQKAAEAEVLQLNASLEAQVASRTAELSQLNVLLSSVMSSASEVSIIATDVDGVIRLFNRGAEQMLGYRAEEMLGKQTPLLIHLREEVRSRSVQLSQHYGEPIEGFRVLVHKPEFDGSETREWTYVAKDGAHIPVTLVVTAMRDEAGQLSGYLSIALDISERKATEQRLAESLETTRAVLDTVVNPVITFDEDGRIHSLNPAGELVFGFDCDQVSDRQISELFVGGAQKAFARFIADAVANPNTERTNNIELWGLRQDGSSFPLQLSVGTMQLVGKLMMVCVITDLTQQQAQRQELMAARDQVIMAAEVAELGIWTWTLADNSLQWNQRMFELYDQPASLQFGGLNYDHWYMRVHPDDVEATAAQLAGAVAGTCVFDPIFRVVRPDGSILHIQGGARVQRDASGAAVKVTGINRDITTQLQLETQLRNAKQQADAASEAKSAFLANMSHEIRTPMNAVLGMLQLVQKTPLNPRQLDYVLKAQNAAQSMLSLLNDILDYSKIEAGKLLLDPHVFELEQSMRELAVVLAGNQGQKDVEVMFDLDTELPGSLIGDSLRLQQVMINLAGNALKFTSHGQVVISLRQLQRSGSSVTVRIAVADTGIGISPEQIERIFEGFNQAEASTTRRFGGTGLGLVICKRLIQLMGGELQVESQVGFGSRFWFDIVLDVAEGGSLRANCPGSGAPLRILIADDNEVAGELLLSTSEALGWQAEHVGGGLAAVARIDQAVAEKKPFDVVLMDWRMPDLDGLSAAQQIHLHSADERPPLVLMITAHGREILADRYQDANAPFVDFLTKPVTPRQLAVAVERALHGEAVDIERQRYVPEKRLQGLRLLVVEDNMLNRQVAEELLAGEGARVQLAECGLEGVAMALAEQPPFDAVLMDIQMPDIDGLEATRRIRQHAHCQRLPIIAMTANASAADREACLRAGMNDHTAKPIDLTLLISTLLHWTRSAIPEADRERATEPNGVLESRASILARFGGNEALLSRVLDSFAPELNKQLERLRELAAKDDGKGVAAVLHTLKGSAGTMGAQRFSLRAGELEEVVRHAQADWLGALLADPTWQVELQELLDRSVEQLLREFGGAPAQAAIDHEPMARAEWRRALSKILTLLESGNLDALEQTEALGLRTPETLRPAFEAFAQSVAMLDFGAALISGRALLTQFKEA